MTQARKCKKCGAELAADLKGSVCPRCALSLALSATVDGGVADAPTPTTIGPYKLLQRLGEGGMGEVWLAAQAEPVRRQVAVKIIKHGLNSKQFIARFESERQALALMDHPSVAKVIDAGTTPDDRPYLVMEYVQGLPITEYCDRYRLNVRDRLDLFRRVCEGVQHAHQKAIIHRDLKPSNVLVATHDGRALPKIIDFGVAKATGQKLTEQTLFTELGVLIGTPEYMSPEQAAASGDDVDTRTDVYSLGVILYELLVGALPFDPRQLRKAGYEGIRRIIREEEPSKPSTRLRTLPGATEELARKRRTDLRSWARQLRADLDWITMKALEKERGRRYGSPAELAEDLARYLSDQPVLAGPPGLGYRAGKFLRRHTLAATAAALLFLSLIAGLAGTGYGMIRAMRAETTARRDAATAEQISRFLVGLFEVSDPSESRGNSITAREILDRGVERIEQELVDQPEVRAGLMLTMGDVYRGLGLYEPAERLLERSADERRRLLGEAHPDALASKVNLALLYLEQGQYDRAEPLFAETLELREERLGPQHQDTLRTKNNLANVLYRQARYEEAVPLYHDILASRRRVLGSRHGETLQTLNNLANAYYSQGLYEDAEPFYREALATQREVQGSDHPETLGTMNNLANLYADLGRHELAEELYTESLRTKLQVLGPEHPSTLVSKGNLAFLYVDQARFAEAESLYLETRDVRRRVLGDSHPSTLASVQNLANLYWKQGRYSEAEPLYTEVFERQREQLGDDHPATIGSLSNLALLQWSLGHEEASEPLFRRALDAKRRVLGGEHLSTLNAMSQLATLLVGLDRHAEAQPLLEEALEIMTRVLGPEHASTLDCMENLATCYVQAGREEEARALSTRVIELRRARAEGADASAAERHALARALLHSRPADLRDARAAMRYASQACEATEFRIPEYLSTLAQAYRATGDEERAIETARRALQLLSNGDSRLRTEVATLLGELEAGDT